VSPGAAIDTIAAPATPPGRGGIGIVRISGPRAAAIASSVCGGALPARSACLRTFRDPAGEPIDTGIALLFRAPHSFTGEDVCELQGHGGPVVMDLLMQAVCAQGARPARPGEFSERAYLNGRLDLAQAEAIADLIDAASAQAARSALRSLSGAFSERVDALLADLVELRCFVEAAIDFPEEEIDFLADARVVTRIDSLIERVDAVHAAAHSGAALREGVHVVLAGRPNAGKSSLLNRLTGQDTAIVSAQPGTTRDVVRERILLDGLPLHLADTAGLRDSPDEIEREGIRRTLAELGRADRLLLIVDSSAGESARTLIEHHLSPLDIALPPITVILNKCDLSGLAPGPQPDADPPAIALSAHTGAGIDSLEEHLRQCVGYTASPTEFSARPRHLDALRRTRAALEAALQAPAAGELLAEHLREAQAALGEITGAFGADELLGRIFASFCIGK
jgi:tRNA modification GTPase